MYTPYPTRQENWLKEHENRDSESELDAQAWEPASRISASSSQRSSANKHLQNSAKPTPSRPSPTPRRCFQALKPGSHSQRPTPRRCFQALKPTSQHQCPSAHSSAQALTSKLHQPASRPTPRRPNQRPGVASQD
ncbi:hypothetical protein PIB30_059758 [Stylosanthes scabra]|uniref:Uncharacterized protein n=1 Tax=Stylosanthes scabra TaxID=79078 RepID=A0ABU6YJ79_9FABA|nr:hypothetical protein [Stylosanthes scabra]